jgi:predicted ribosomally synthesized peptide with nif11-like leader
MALQAFAKAVAADRQLQGLVKACRQPQEIVDYAAAQGFDVSIQQLRTYATDLSAPWWPWAESGQEGRRAFFSRRASG